MKIKISALRKLIKEQVILELEQREVPKLDKSDIIDVLESYGITKDVAEKDGVTNYDAMISSLSEELKGVAEHYASTNLLMSDEKSKVMVKAALFDSGHYGTKELPSFIRTAVSRGLIDALSDKMKVTLKGRAESEPDEQIVVGVMSRLLNQLQKSIDSFNVAKKSLGDAIEGSADQPGLSQLPDMFDQYGYEYGSRMANQLLGNLSPINDQIDDIGSKIGMQMSDLMKMQGDVGKAKRSGQVKFKDKLLKSKSANVGASAARDMTKTKPG